MFTSWFDQPRRLVVIFIFALWIVLAVTFGAYDLAISKSLVDFQSNWATFFQRYGQLPGMITNMLSTNLLFNLRTRHSGTRNNIFAAILGIYAAVASSEFWGDVMGLQSGFDVSIPAIILLGLITVIGLQALFHRLSLETLKPYERPATVAVLLTVISGILTTWTLKFTWGRVRFRDLAPDFSDFTPWYLPQGINGNQSFISGHTTYAWLVLPWILLFKPGTARYRNIVLAVIIWGVVNGLSRVVIGAHYASDVLFSTAFTIGWFILLDWWIPKKSLIFTN